MWTVTVHVGQTRVCHYGKLCTVIKRLWSVWWEWRIYLVYCSHGWFPMLIHFHFNSRRQQFGIFLSPLHFFHPLSYYWSDTGHYLQEGGCRQQRAAKCRSGPTLRGFEHTNFRLTWHNVDRLTVTESRARPCLARPFLFWNWPDNIRSCSPSSVTKRESNKIQSSR